jgi:hypothetical protein
MRKRQARTLSTLLELQLDKLVVGFQTGTGRQM